MKKIHIGKIIKEVFYKSPMSMVEFAKQLGVNRETGYTIFTRKSIQTDMLLKIGKALKHDFFKYYSDTLKIKK